MYGLNNGQVCGCRGCGSVRGDYKVKVTLYIVENGIHLNVRLRNGIPFLVFH